MTVSSEGFAISYSGDDTSTVFFLPTGAFGKDKKNVRVTQRISDVEYELSEGNGFVFDDGSITVIILDSPLLTGDRLLIVYDFQVEQNLSITPLFEVDVESFEKKLDEIATNISNLNRLLTHTAYFPTPETLYLPIDFEADKVVYHDGSQLTYTNAPIAPYAVEKFGIMAVADGHDHDGVNSKVVDIADLSTSGASNGDSVKVVGSIPEWGANQLLITPRNLQVALVWDSKPSGTAGGASSGGFYVRNLNQLYDPNSIVTSLAADTITLPAGTYQIIAYVPARGPHQAVLYDATAAGVPVTGSSEVNGLTARVINTISTINGTVSPASPNAYQIAHSIGIVSATGMGSPSSISGVEEIYTQIIIIKID